VDFLTVQRLKVEPSCILNSEKKTGEGESIERGNYGVWGGKVSLINREDKGGGMVIATVCTYRGGGVF